MSKFPDELVRIAATGSNPRTQATVEQSIFPLLKHWQTDDISAERDLLISIAGYSLQNLAGFMPSKHSHTLPPKANISNRRACTLTAQQHLKLMLNHVHEDLLPHWIDAVHKYGQHIPDEMLPSVLDYGSKQAQNHALLRKAVGERGQWLAQQAKNTDWDWILDDDTKEIEHESHYRAWENYFRRLRQQDPIQALELLKQHWDSLDALMKMALLSAMEEGLNENDGDFLWQLFGDETTRFAAARWLLKLEDSEFAQQARANISKLLAMVQIGHQKQWVVDFTWSPTFDEHPMQIKRSDGSNLCHIMGYDFNSELMLMLLPLSYWYETYDVTPDTLVMAAHNSTRPSIFFRIWKNKAIHDEDSDFLFALVMNVERHAGSSLMTYLSQGQLIEAATHWLQKKPLFSLQHNVIVILDAINETWSEELANIFLDSLDACFNRVPRPLLDTNMRQKLKHYARFLPLSVDERFEDVLHMNKREELSDSEIEQLNGIIDIVRFRADMIEAIQAGVR